MEEFVNSIAQAMLNSLGAQLTVLLLAMIPIAEARFAILFGVSSLRMSPIEAFGWAFLGSSIMAPILLLTFIPIINALSKTKVFAKLGKFLYDKFESKSKAIDGTKENSNGQSATPPHNKWLSKRDLQKMGGTALFVAVPLPLTGVWTGSAVASIVKLGFLKGLISIILGNAVACGIMALLSWAFAPYLTYITIGFAIAALAVVVFLIVKFIMYKPKDKAETDAKQNDTQETTTENKDTSSASDSTDGNDSNRSG